MNARHQLLALLSIFTIVTYTSCTSADTEKKGGFTDTLTEQQIHLSGNALRGLVIADGLRVQMMASEPAIKNPTDIDVDDRGRIYVTEAYNYRPESNGNPTNPAGDRIMILEDKDGDGIAETSKIYYQGPEINAPLGVCVLGNRVIVSQSPYVWAFYDDNGDDKADRKEIIFQGISGIQHDHGMHTFSAGPDGKLYFNFGNEGKTLRDKNNKPVLDQDGDSISPKKYKMGMVFRCEPDGSHVECLGNNFRNNYEVATDSYANMWQSDNDDDGNRGVRINYVMDYGNYGYTDEMTGASWSSPRTNMEDSIPLRHWHLNDPGVVPNLLQTGSGSPTGMVFYEGSLLPEKFRNQMIHCEPGHNVVRSYPVKKDGAGYTAAIENILSGEHDQWFRPADVCVAPDGSLIVADWYDPGVGGHGAGDQQKGRIYRIAPDTGNYKMPKFDYTTVKGAITALENPNKAVQYNAWHALHNMAQQAVPDLEEVWKSNSNSRMRARAFWVLVKMPGGEKYIADAINQHDADLRIVGLRAARQLHANVIGAVQQLINDKDPQVLRECAIALHFNKSPEAAGLWATLASKYDGRDRWYLEALGIGADKQWDRFFDAFVQKVKDPLQNNATRDIVWRARTDKTLPLLKKLATDQAADWKSRQRYFRAFDFNTSKEKSKVLLSMLSDNKSNDPDLNILLLHHLDAKEVKNSAVANAALSDVLVKEYGTPAYVQLVTQYQVKSEAPKLLQLAVDKSIAPIGSEALQLYMQLGNSPKLKDLLKSKGDTAKSIKLVEPLGTAGNGPAVAILQDLVLSPAYPTAVRMAAAADFGKSWSGNEWVMNLLKSNSVPENMKVPLIEGLKKGMRPDMYERAQAYLPGAEKKTSETKNITANEILSVKAVAANGKRVFRQNCMVCHSVKGEGKDFGPKLTEIGDKLPKEALFEAVTSPSKSVGFGYETSEITMKDGSSFEGIISSKTENDLDVKFPGGTIQKFKRADIKSTKTIEKSMMPDLHEAMKKQELADLIEYLSTLKKG
ncbi:MAG: c-type cytochrome [Chitinophagaceae bacterium]|nr:c-type cytochrome [Chitinophagaceae bacterium]